MEDCRLSMFSCDLTHSLAYYHILGRVLGRFIALETEDVKTEKELLN
jgi:hypothetical protein